MLDFSLHRRWHSTTKKGGVLSVITLAPSFRYLSMYVARYATAAPSSNVPAMLDGVTVTLNIVFIQLAAQGGPGTKRNVFALLRMRLAKSRREGSGSSPSPAMFASTNATRENVTKVGAGPRMAWGARTPELKSEPTLDAVRFLM